MYAATCECLALFAVVTIDVNGKTKYVIKRQSIKSKDEYGFVGDNLRTRNLVIVLVRIAEVKSKAPYIICISCVTIWYFFNSIENPGIYSCAINY